MFVYKPPMRGAPGNRMGGGTRGPQGKIPLLAVLAPDHTGLTIRDNPIFYWYISDLTSKSLEFTLNDEDIEETLLETKIHTINKSGMQKLKLSDYKQTLLPEKEYSWFIRMIVNPDHPSKDIYAKGYVKRVAPSETLADKLAKADRRNTPGIYAEEGIWYDALSELSLLIEANPGDNILLEQRNKLLEQAELDSITELERKKRN